jgi:transcriptional regulator with XRE-family HTH domain
MRITLRSAILRAGTSQRAVAKRAGLTENKLSAIVQGWRDPSPAERIAIADALGRSPHASLFRDYQAIGPTTLPPQEEGAA